MFGAIIGDIVGSVYEFDNIKTKDFKMFGYSNFFTDDTVMTIAVAEALMDYEERGSFDGDDGFINSLRKWGHKYPNAGYGAKFNAWLRSDSREPYKSYGNGSAMRVSPVAFFFAINNARCSGISELAKRCAAVTHNHPEGIKGAQATAESIMHMRYGREGDGDIEGRRASLRGLIEMRYGYDLSRTLDEIRPTYRFDESCQKTVPEAITAFIESVDFEDAIRNAISLGGDSDTLAAITGGIAEAAYGIPQAIKDKALTYLDEPIAAVCRRWEERKKW